MKKLTIEVTGANGTSAMTILNAVQDAIDSCSGCSPQPIESIYRYEDEPVPILPAPESTPFSRYISNTTPEGRT